MKLKDEKYERIAVITISGELTADELEPFRRLIDKRLADDTRDFVLDVGEMGFVDSKGLETLLWLQEQAGERLGQVRLARPTDIVRTILHVTRLEHHLDAHDDVEGAMKSLR
jgi:anti-sigma B factor antagonist